MINGQDLLEMRRWSTTPWHRGCVAALLGLAVCLLASCSYRLPDSGSVFEQFAYETPRAKKPESSKKLKTEYPTAENWGPRVAEYRGEDDVRGRTISHNGVSSSAGKHQVNFNNADLSEVVRVVLLDTLQLGYVLDPAVAGKVTVTSPTPLTRKRSASAARVDPEDESRRDGARRWPIQDCSSSKDAHWRRRFCAIRR